MHFSLGCSFAHYFSLSEATAAPGFDPANLARNRARAKKMVSVAMAAPAPTNSPTGLIVRSAPASALVNRLDAERGKERQAHDAPHQRAGMRAAGRSKVDGA